MREHGFEPVPGLPEVLPRGEKLLWQGAPDFRALALHAMHVRALAVYFALLMLLRGQLEWAGGAGLAASVASTTWLAVLGAVCIGIACLFAWMYSRTTLYTITTRRVVIRTGIALDVAINLPFKQIHAAGLRRYRGAGGEIALETLGKRISYILLWPNVRPWRFNQPQAMLRALPDAEAVAAVLSTALAGAQADHGTQSTSAPAPGVAPVSATVAAA
ncbi:MAG: PH domain-containing protein [Gammaproteobacteria bacterium]|nr:PH domain-containing protein [Gammaproteobacteria bacterium]NNM01865.1 PH domain-containing protein [Gammaproteobacteria bacterium]